MAHSEFFGKYSFLKVFIAGTLGGMAGDSFGYMIGRIFHEKAKHYRFYQMAQPRVERLIDKFGGFAIIISKYIYGIRAAMCVFYGIGKMPFPRFIALDAASCGIWVLLLSGAGYFFSGAITSIIGDFQQIGIALFFLILFAVIVIYTVERFWLSERVEEANPETHSQSSRKSCSRSKRWHRSNSTISTERLHLTREPNGDGNPLRTTKSSRKLRTPLVNKHYKICSYLCDLCILASASSALNSLNRKGRRV